MTIKESLDHLKQEIPSGVKLVAVSKTQAASRIKEAYDAGQRIFGENKAQELGVKQALLPADIEWHFIGHLQSNKVKIIAPFVKMIHGVDSLRLLKEIDKEAERNQRTIDCLLEIFISKEETKFGLDPEEAGILLSSPDFHALRHIRMRGVMGMATFSDDEALVSGEFRFLKECFTALAREFFPEDPGFSEISMGMSGDYKLAIREGSTMVRIGSALFGNR